MSTRICTALLICLAMAVPGDAYAQCQVNELELRDMTKAARAKHPKNDKEFLKALDAAVKGPGKLTTDPIVVHYSPEMTIAALAPYSAYRISLETRLRKMEPIDTAPYAPEFTVFVNPRQIDAPDVERLVLQRDGVTVEPLRNELKAEEMTTRMGAKRMIHNGQVYFSCDAFARTATVTITAIPRVGNNFTRTIKPDLLAELY